MKKGRVDGRSTFEKYSVAVDGKLEEVVNYTDIKSQLIPSSHNGIDHNNLFLGNGFNLSAGIQTSHKHLGEALGDIPAVEKILPGLKKEAGKPGFNIEKFFPNPDKAEKQIEWGDEIIHAGCAGLVQREFFRILIAQTKKRFQFIVNGIVVSFLADFESIFTTNYDPMLHLLSNAIRDSYRTMNDITDMREQLPEFIRDRLMEIGEPVDGGTEVQGNLLEKEVDEIGQGSIVIGKDELVKIRDLPKPLSIVLIHHLLSLRVPEKVSIRLVRGLWELAVPARDLKGEIRGTMLDLKDKRFLERYDGFEKLVWKPGDKQNLFYLHGAFHIYAESKSSIYKVRGASAPRLIDALSELKEPHLSIFQPEGKEGKINDSDYLIHCSDKLRDMKGPLCIIGWRCDDSDEHLARRIAASDANPIFVSVYKEKGDELELFRDIDYPVRDSELKRTISSYRKHLRKKDLVFFDIGTVDYLN